MSKFQLFWSNEDFLILVDFWGGTGTIFWIRIWMHLWCCCYFCCWRVHCCQNYIPFGREFVVTLVELLGGDGFCCYFQWLRDCFYQNSILFRSNGVVTLVGLLGRGDFGWIQGVVVIFTGLRAFIIVIKIQSPTWESRLESWFLW